MPSSLYAALKVLTETPAVRTFLVTTDPKALDQAVDALAAYDECEAKQCSYYQHYLAYGPPDLTHEGYHAAEEHCSRAQSRCEQWFKDHPTGRLPRHLEEYARIWEARVRA